MSTEHLLRTKTIDTPIRRMWLLACSQYLHEISWNALDAEEVEGPHPVLDSVVQQLREYFRGSRMDFDVPLKASGTPFQKRSWQSLCDIPYGETRSYQQQARAIATANHCRAVGSANGKNPHSIIVPCHRVIAADGTLGGFGGGLAAKQWLLDHEAQVKQSKA